MHSEYLYYYLLFFPIVIAMILRLPHDILVVICELVSPRDLCALRETCQQLSRDIPGSFILGCLLSVWDCCNIEYSRSNDDTCQAPHKLNNSRVEFSDQVKCPVYIDQPLPRDFYCLCKEVDEIFPWEYHDNGISFDEKLLDLTEHPEMGQGKPKKGLTMGRYYGSTYAFGGAPVIQTRHSSKMLAGVSVINLIYSGIPQTRGIVNLDGLSLPFRLQVNGKSVLLHARACDYKTSEVICVSPGGKVHTQRCRPRKAAPAGIVHYNDTFFNIDFQTRYRLRVCKSLHSLDSDPQLSEPYKVYQDEEYSQFCLVYKPTGIIIGLIDLDNQQTEVFSAPGTGFVARNYSSITCEEYLVMVGMSKGSLGIWKFSINHLRKRFRFQHGDGFANALSLAVSPLASKPR